MIDRPSSEGSDGKREGVLIFSDRLLASDFFLNLKQAQNDFILLYSQKIEKEKTNNVYIKNEKRGLNFF